MRSKIPNFADEGTLKLRVVQTQAISFWKSMSERGVSDIEFKNKMAWVRVTLKMTIMKNRNQK